MSHNSLYRWVACITLAIAAFAFGCSKNANQLQEKPLRHVKLLIDWKAEPTYAGFYVAKARGFYRNRGLDVEIIEGNGANTSAQIIGSGKEYFVGSCSGEATAIARSKGVPIRSVAVYYPNVPTVIYSRSDTPILKPADMIGKRIGLIDGSISVDEYRGIITANHIDRSKIHEVGVGFDAAPLLSKKVDGLMNYEELTPVELRLQGFQIEVMRFADYGLNAYSLNLIVNDDSLRENGDIVRAIVDASSEGYAFLRQDPKTASAIFVHLFPERNPNYIQQSINTVARLLGTGPVGAQTRGGWEETIAALNRLGLLDHKIAVDDVVAKEYLVP
jgi:ABC-type nitrate/sulfonate/bicarbonate transport system substrate-binding protein